MPAPRKYKLPASPELRKYIANAVDEYECAEIAIERMVAEFIAQCVEERTEARHEALEEAGVVRGKRRVGDWVRACPFTLHFRFHKQTLEIYWSEQVHFKGSRGKSTPRNGPPVSEGKTDMRRILAKALPLEIDLLRSHEIKARELRKTWAAYVVSRRAVKTFFNGLADASQDSDGTGRTPYY